MDGTDIAPNQPADQPAQPTDTASDAQQSNAFFDRLLMLLETRWWPDSLVVRSGAENFWPTENSPDGQAIKNGHYHARAPDQKLAIEQLSGSGIKYRYADENVRGFRNNNFGNISYSAFAREQSGFAGSDGRFAQFATPEDGLRSMDALLTVYQEKHGLKSVQDIISRWAPPNENDTSWYYTYVAKRMGLNSAQDVVTPDKRAALISAIVQVECGYDPFGEDRIKQVLAGHDLSMANIVPVGPQTRMAGLGAGEGKGHESGDALLQATNGDYHLSAFGNNRDLQRRFMDRLGIQVDPSKTAWCAYWLNSQLAANGLPVLLARNGQPTGWAYDFINYGQRVGLADARPGDIVVFDHHVGFLKEIRDGQAIIRGGNQDSKVEDDAFSIGSIKAIRRPPFTGEVQEAKSTPQSTPSPPIAAPVVSTTPPVTPQAPPPVQSATAQPAAALPTAPTPAPGRSVPSLDLAALRTSVVAAVDAELERILAEHAKQVANAPEAKAESSAQKVVNALKEGQPQKVAANEPPKANKGNHRKVLGKDTQMASADTKSGPQHPALPHTPDSKPSVA